MVESNVGPVYRQMHGINTLYKNMGLKERGEWIIVYKCTSHSSDIKALK